ncbi:SYFA ligase, partial [Nycticryphes semicollaris]|nr:SYFA ligase [Nycticryphes semicollaris]
FTEMPTNNFVESSFWNFDALFQPQQHPARDQHDTFFLQDPAEAPELPPGYTSKVKKVHSQGGYGSQGYKYDWRLEEARKNLLRTHTTSASARALYQLARQEKFSPVKYFSIDRVFRNESLDATHLAEFHQVEGVVADRGLTLGHLMGTLRQFFNKMGMEWEGVRGGAGGSPGSPLTLSLSPGISQLRFKPAYNPYTEPSMEVFSYHEGLKKWVEVGNSGVFRP